MRARRRSVLLVATSSLVPLLMAACRGPSPETAGGLTAQVDSSGDTVRIVLSGTLDSAATRELVAESTLRPAHGDAAALSDVSEVEIDRAGRIWAFDPGSRSLALFAPTGQLIRRQGRAGAGPGEFGCVSGMAVLADDGLGVWDPCNGRVVLLDSAGIERGTVRTPSGYRGYDGLKRDRDGALYIKQPMRDLAGVGGNRPIGLMTLATDGRLGDALAPPDITVNEIRYVDAKGGSIAASQSPRLTWAWHPEGYLVAATGASYRVVLARRREKPMVLTREGVPPVPLLEAEREAERIGIVETLQQGQPDWQWRGPELPRVKLPITSLFVGRDGLIWVRVATPSVEVASEDLAEAGAPGKRRFSSEVRYDVYQADGLYRQSVRVPSRTQLLEADGDQVWGLVRDDDDLPAIVRFRVSPRP